MTPQTSFQELRHTFKKRARHAPPLGGKPHTSFILLLLGLSFSSSSPCLPLAPPAKPTSELSS